MADTAQFWNKLAPRYARKPVPDESIYEKKLEITRSYMRPEHEVLEFGCGTGSTALRHAPHVRSIRATDFSSEMIHIAREKAQDQGITNVDFRVAPVTELKGADETYDVVLGLSILHLLKEKDDVIRWVYRLLRPGGVFVTSTACIADISRLLGFIAPLGGKLGLLPEISVFTRDNLLASFESAGFALDHVWEPHSKKTNGIFVVAKKPE